MGRTPKVRVTVTLSSDLLDRIERHVARHKGATRSGVIEAWLQMGRDRKRNPHRADLEAYCSERAKRRRR
jgi:metal-responsive CopG/Arc/MetJ family transcriptional regulator